MSGLVADWVLAHLPAEANSTDRLAAVILALRADHDGSGADRTRQQIAELAGVSLAAVSRSLRRLDAWHITAAGADRPGRHRPRARMILVRWCEPEADCYPCQQLAGYLRRPVTSDKSSRRKVVAGDPKTYQQRQPLRNGNGSRHADQRSLAARTAALNLRVVE